MRLNSKALAILVIALMFGGIALSAALGWWNTANRAPGRFGAGRAAGQPIPAEIRGSYAFGEIASWFSIPLADLQTAFPLPAEGDPATFKCKDLEQLYAGLPYEIGTASVQLFLAWYSGLPIEEPVDVYLPAPAVDLLKSRGRLNAEQIAYLDAHRVELTAVSPLPVTAVAESEEHAANDRQIRGKTTFQEVLGWGVPRDVVERIIGGPIPAPGMKIRDYCSAKGLPFATVRDALQAEVDRR